MVIGVGGASTLWAAPFPRQVVLSFIRKLAEYEPTYQSASSIPHGACHTSLAVTLVSWLEVMLCGTASPTFKCLPQLSTMMDWDLESVSRINPSAPEVSVLVSVLIIAIEMKLEHGVCCTNQVNRCELFSIQKAFSPERQFWVTHPNNTSSFLPSSL